MSEKRTIKRVGIVVKQYHDRGTEDGSRADRLAKEHGIDPTGGPYSETHEDQSFDPEVDLVVVFGGDGTMISTARLVEDHDPLVLGINYGSLGYLTDFRIEEMVPALEMMLAGEYEIDHRVMLDAEHIRNGEAIAKGPRSQRCRYQQGGTGTHHRDRGAVSTAFRQRAFAPMV